MKVGLEMDWQEVKEKGGASLIPNVAQKPGAPGAAVFDAFVGVHLHPPAWKIRCGY